MRFRILLGLLLLFTGIGLGLLVESNRPTASVVTTGLAPDYVSLPQESWTSVCNQPDNNQFETSSYSLLEGDHHTNWVLIIEIVDQQTLQIHYYHSFNGRVDHAIGPGFYAPSPPPKDDFVFTSFGRLFFDYKLECSIFMEEHNLNHHWGYQPSLLGHTLFAATAFLPLIGWGIIALAFMFKNTKTKQKPE